MLEAFNGPEHPGFAPTTFGALTEEARQFDHSTLGETEWINGRNEDGYLSHVQFRPTHQVSYASEK